MPDLIPELGFPRGLREKRAHQRLQRLPVAARTLVVATLALTDRERQAHFLLALLAVELVVRHVFSSSAYRAAGVESRRQEKATPRAVPALDASRYGTRSR